jgi:hypothetical protein
MTLRLAFTITITAALLGLAGTGVFAMQFAAGGSDYQVPRYAVAGGGGASTGGDFTVHGTIGQAEAGALVGGDPGNELVLVGGFWAGGSAEPHPPCAPADLNCDGVVDVSDLLLLLAAWGPCPENQDCPGDLDGDGAVDVSDLLILLANWG